MEHVSPLDRRQRIETRGYFVVPFENVVQTRGREKRRGSLFEIVRIIIIRDVCNRCLEGMEVDFRLSPRTNFERGTGELIFTLLPYFLRRKYMYVYKYPFNPFISDE